VVNNAAVVQAGQVDQPRPEFWKLTRDGKRPSAVTVESGTGLPTVTPVWGDVPPGAGKLENGKVVFHVDGTDLLPAVKAGCALTRIGVPGSKIEVRSGARVFSLEGLQ
jgi:hypothetical protein